MTRRIGTAAAAIAALIFAGCDGTLFGLESPPPTEVMELLPLPADAVVDDAGCVGEPRRQGFTCVVHANSLQSMERGSDEASRRMSAWKEYSWDWVRGRIQWSWTRERETVSLAIHDMGERSKWSLTYMWGEYPDPIPHDHIRAPQRAPGVQLPAVFASLPVPPGATLLDASSTPGGPHAEATYSFVGDPSAVLAPYRSMNGWTKSMDARAPWAKSVAARRDATEIVASVWTANDGTQILKLRSQPAIGG